MEIPFCISRTSCNLRSKKTSQEVANDTTDTVLGKHIEAFIDTENKLELRSKVAADTTDDTEDESRPGGDVTSTGGDGDETGNGTGAETNRGPLLLKPVIEENPSKTSGASSEMSDDEGHGSTVVGGEGGTTVEAEPTDPEENRPENDVGDVVRAVGEAVDLGVAGALTQHKGVSESCGTRADVDGGTTSEVETAHLQGPSLEVPGPESNGIVDDRGPDEDEDVGGEHATTISDSANSEGGTKKGALSEETAEGYFSVGIKTYVMAANMPWYRQKRISGSLPSGTKG